MSNALAILNCDSIGICQDTYQKAVDYLGLDDIDALVDLVIDSYADEITITKSIPSVESLANLIDDIYAGELDSICYALGLEESETDYIMSRYVHNIASYLDIKIQDILDNLRYTHISLDDEVIEYMPLGINGLWGGSFE